jgi:dihydroorotase
LKSKGSLTAGADADLTILATTQAWTVDVNKFHSKSRNSPFHGWQLIGRPVMTVVKGKVVATL